MKRLLLATVLVLSGCGTLPTKWQLKKVSEEVTGPTPGCPLRVMARHYDPEFEPYLLEFQHDAKKYEVGCHYTHSIYFADKLEKDIAGYCMYGDRIVISREVWLELDLIQKTMLIYHEIGHCGFHLDHTRSNEWSIMNPNLLPSYMLEGYWDVLVKHMFEKARKEQRR